MHGGPGLNAHIGILCHYHLATRLLQISHLFQVIRYYHYKNIIKALTV